MTKVFTMISLPFITTSLFPQLGWGCPLCETETAEVVRAGVISTFHQALAPLAVILPFLGVYVAVFVMDFRWGKIKKESD